jgi:hypothetical protein
MRPHAFLKLSQQYPQIEANKSAWNYGEKPTGYYVDENKGYQNGGALQSRRYVWRRTSLPIGLATHLG